MDAAFQDEVYHDPVDEENLLALGINPLEPTLARPGSEDKVQMLAARYAAGLPLWHEEDCRDHSVEFDFFEDDIEF
jgi:hypothetical protein